MTVLEVLAVVFGLISILLARAKHVWTWPTGIVNVALMLVVVMGSRLYADAALQVVFLGLSAYGWWKWTRPGLEAEELPVTRLTVRGAAIAAVAVAAGALLLGAFLARRTDAAFPYWNATTTALSLLAQVLLARRVLENWIVWVAVDVQLVALYASASPPLDWLAGLYVVYGTLATSGYLAWRRSALSPQAA